MNKKYSPEARLSTLGVASPVNPRAFHLLAQNYKILKRWDLAVTAYNSGTKHLLRAQQRLRKRNIDLDYIFKNYHSAHLGFASKNFYSEFLALVYVLEYKQLLYPLKGVSYSSLKRENNLRYNNINIYLSKCGLIPERLYASMKKTSPNIAEVNDHLTMAHTMYPRGTIIFSDFHLPTRRYYRIPPRELVQRVPKSYRRLIRHKGCNSV